MTSAPAVATITTAIGVRAARKSRWPARLRMQKRERARSDEDFYERVGDDKGVFGCLSLPGCQDVCPKKLPLATQLAFIRRKMVAIGWS
jgi:fumarate reductase iron-sulfur subunit